MSIYIVRQKGVYWHEILHVGNNKYVAINIAKDLAVRDRDSYHDFVVGCFELNKIPKARIKEKMAIEPVNYEIEVFRTDKDKEASQIPKVNKLNQKSDAIDRLSKLATKGGRRALSKLLESYIRVNGGVVEYLNHDGSFLTADMDLFIECKLKKSTMFTSLVKGNVDG